MTTEARASLRAGPSPAAIVLGVHAGALIYLLAVHEPDVVGGNMDVVTVELAPIDSLRTPWRKMLRRLRRLSWSPARCPTCRSHKKSRRSK